MEIRSRSRRADGLAPGTDPAALRVITAVVLIGLLITGAAVVAAGSGAQPAVPGGVVASSPAQRAGLKLLSSAARASDSVAYQGVEVLATWGPVGISTSVMDVWHQRGGHTLAKVAPATAALHSRAQVPAPFRDPSHIAGLDSNGVLGMTGRLVSLLAANYQVAVTGRGDVVGRPARVVTVRRSDGSMAARFWLDSVTSLPLRRQLYDAGEHLVSDVAFAQLTYVRGALTDVPGPGAQRWGDTLSAARLAALRARGWPLPGPLPGKLTLLSAREAGTASGPVIDLGYSDGLSVVSIFVQRGHLPADPSGWSVVALQGHKVYANDADDLSVTWSAHGFVYTVIAAAPVQTVGQVVAALPHQGEPGFLGRIRRGLRRLFSWASP